MICLLMRNMRPKMGLVNGRRLRIVAIRATIVEVEVIGGVHDGERSYIPRIKFEDRKSYCFVFKRLQVRRTFMQMHRCNCSSPCSRPTRSA